MKRVGLIAVIILLSSTLAFPQLGKKLLDQAKKTVSGAQPLTAEEVAQGLKEALTNGISKGSDLTSKVDGYFKNPEIKIPFPPDVKKVEDRLRQMGLNDQVDKFVLSLNRAKHIWVRIPFPWSCKIFTATLCTSPLYLSFSSPMMRIKQCGSSIPAQARKHLG